MPDLRVQNLTKRYSVGPNIIDDLTYTFSSGKVYSFAGKNGSGKTTLLHLLTVFSFPTSGEVLWGGSNIHKKPRPFFKESGFVVPALHLPEELSLDELVEWRTSSLGITGNEEYIAELYEKLNFDERSAQPLSTYSSGMRRKAELITAICTKPKVLLLDEPFETLDDDSRIQLQHLLEDLKQNGTLIILATHLHDSYVDLVDETLEFPIGGD
jgi:ABC-2 type transport system ATP-binding protein